MTPRLELGGALLVRMAELEDELRFVGREAAAEAASPAPAAAAVQGKSANRM